MRGRGQASSSSAICRFSASGTAEPSHMCDWNSGASPLGDPLLRDREQRPDEAVELVLRAVVGVQRDVDRVVLGDLVRVRGERDRAGDHVLDGRAGQVLGTAGGDLDDAVAAGLGEALQGGVERLRGADVDRRVGERAGLGAVEHLGVDLGRGDRHGRLLGDEICFRGTAAWRRRHCPRQAVSRLPGISVDPAPGGRWRSVDRCSQNSHRNPGPPEIPRRRTLANSPVEAPADDRSSSSPRLARRAVMEAAGRGFDDDRGPRGRRVGRDRTGAYGESPTKTTTAGSCTSPTGTFNTRGLEPSLVRPSRPRDVRAGRTGAARVASVPTPPVGDGLALPALRRLRASATPKGRGPADDAPRSSAADAQLRDLVILRLLAVERLIRGLLVLLAAYAVFRFRDRPRQRPEGVQRGPAAVETLADKFHWDIANSSIDRHIQKRHRDRHGHPHLGRGRASLVYGVPPADRGDRPLAAQALG